MAGIYTNLAKKRAEQSKEHPSVPQVPETTPAVSVSALPHIDAVRTTSTIDEEHKKPANPQAGKPANPSPASLSQEQVEKYTTRLEPSLVKKIQLHAIEHDMKDYEVVRTALNLYLRKQP
jgi:hypothetical protein